MRVGRDAAASKHERGTKEQQRIALLADVAHCMSGSLPHEAALVKIAELSMPHLDAWCIVDLVRDASDGAPDENVVRLAVLHSDPGRQHAAHALHRDYPPHGNELIGATRVLRTRRTEVVHDVSDQMLADAAKDDRHLDLLRTLGVSAYMVTPLMAHGAPFGAMSFVAETPGRRFDDSDVLLAEELALRAALLVDNARVMQTLEASRTSERAALAVAAELQSELERTSDDARDARVLMATRTARLQALSGALAVASTQQEVAEAVVAHAASVLGAVGLVIAQITATGEQLEIMSAGAMPDDARREWAHFPISAPVPLADVARTGEPVFLESRNAWAVRYPGSEPMLEATGHHANVVVPLIAEGRVLGVLGAAFDAPRDFSEDDRAAALSVAQQCAQALERARLYEAERRARADAEHANRAKSEFLAAMSHELRTPLNAIGGYTQLLDMGIHGPVTPAQREALGRIELAQRYLLRHVNDVLNFERLQSGRLEYDLQSVPLADVVGGVEPMILPQLRTKALSYVVQVPDEQVVQADRDKLTQVIINLLSNAVKFTPAGGRVTIECVMRRDGSSDPNTVYLRVADTGIGIPAEKMDTVFEPFVQVDASPAGRASGAGLGLAISRDLARGMGGDLRVRSTVNVGTTFTVALPRARQDAATGN